MEASSYEAIVYRRWEDGGVHRPRRSGREAGRSSRHSHRGAGCRTAGFPDLGVRGVAGGGQPGGDCRRGPGGAGGEAAGPGDGTGRTEGFAEGRSGCAVDRCWGADGHAVDGSGPHCGGAGDAEHAGTGGQRDDALDLLAGRGRLAAGDDQGRAVECGRGDLRFRREIHGHGDGPQRQRPRLRVPVYRSADRRRSVCGNAEGHGPYPGAANGVREHAAGDGDGSAPGGAQGHGGLSWWHDC